MPQPRSCIQSVQDDYEIRVREIESYFQFLQLLDSSPKEISDVMLERNLDETALLKTLKANCFLLLYNLMESVTKNSIQGLYDHLRNEKTGYDDCCERIKKVILKNIKNDKLGIDTAHTRLKDIMRHIVTETFLVENLLSGSVDASSLRALAKEYGMNSKIASRLSDGTRLNEVKNHRNALAHGSKTFGEVGQDITILDLQEIKSNVFGYMQQFIANVDDFLADRQYLMIA